MWRHSVLVDYGGVFSKGILLLLLLLLLSNAYTVATHFHFFIHKFWVWKQHFMSYAVRCPIRWRMYECNILDKGCVYMRFEDGFCCTSEFRRWSWSFAYDILIILLRIRITFRLGYDDKKYIVNKNKKVFSFIRT